MVPQLKQPPKMQILGISEISEVWQPSPLTSQKLFPAGINLNNLPLETLQLK